MNVPIPPYELETQLQEPSRQSDIDYLDQRLISKTKLRTNLGKIITACALIAGSIAGNPEVAEAACSGTQCDAAGTLELGSTSWLGGSGVDVYSNGPNYNDNGVRHYTDGTYDGDEWQCVELIDRLYLTKGWIKETWFGNGNTIKDHMPADLSFETNGNISFLNPGDVITLTNEGAGHAMIIDSVANGTIHTVSQNTTSVWNDLKINGKTISGQWSGFSVQGVVHHPMDGQAVSGGANTPKPAGEGGGNAASWGVGRIDTFYQNTNATGSNLSQKYFETNVGWKEGLLADSSGYRLSAPPAAVSWGPNRIDLFGRSAGGELITKYYDGTWHNWGKLGGCILGSPTVTSWAPGRLDVFARGCNTTGPNLLQRSFINGWKGWEAVPYASRIASSPAAVSWEQGRIDIVAIEENQNNLIHSYYDENGWHNRESLGGCLTGDPEISSWEPGRLDIFAEGCNTSGQNTYHKVFDSGWNDWELLPGANNETVDKFLGAISWANQRIDIFARSIGGALIQKHWDGNSWSPWESLGSSVAP